MSSTDSKDTQASRPQSALVRWLDTNVDSKKANLISIYACFLTGYTSSISFTACFIWCGFQTGNIAQLGIAIARCFDPLPERTYIFEKPDQQALTSLVAFWIGATLGRIGDRMGAKTRKWLVSASFIQAVLVAFAAVAHHYSGENGYAGWRANPSWTTASGMTALGLISATVGLQGIMGKRIGSPMNTCVVLTTTWVEIFNDPKLLAFGPVPSRDIRVAGALALFFGSFVARAISNGAGVVGALGVLAGMRVLQAVWWGFVRAVEIKPKEAV